MARFLVLEEACRLLNLLLNDFAGVICGDEFGLLDAFLVCNVQVLAILTELYECWETVGRTVVLVHGIVVFYATDALLLNIGFDMAEVVFHFLVNVFFLPFLQIFIIFLIMMQNRLHRLVFGFYFFS